MVISLRKIRISYITSRSMLNDAKTICLNAIRSCLPAEGVNRVLNMLDIDQEVYLVAVGKAAYAMAEEASKLLKIKKGILISKYGHVKRNIPKVECYEAGHPIMDENSINATEKVIELCSDLKENDIVLFLLSGGASALFEKPLISLKELQDLNRQFLSKGLHIEEINTIRKKLSAVKGGKFGQLCKPAKVYSLILSDVLSDRLDMIGSGPTALDESDPREALEIIERYDIEVSDKIRKIIMDNRKADPDNCQNMIIGSVKTLCESACREAEKLGYRPIVISDHIDIEARDAGDLLYQELLKHSDEHNIALIMTGETIVHVKGSGLGGRNQEMVFSQIRNLKGMKDVVMMSLGSDGTDGPTDAAGGYIDGSSYDALISKGLDYEKILEENDSYHGLQALDSLIITGPTGTNVNDISIILKK